MNTAGPKRLDNRYNTTEYKQYARTVKSIIILIFFTPCWHQRCLIGVDVSFQLLSWDPNEVPLFYLTIGLRARDFFEVIVDEGEARIDYHFIQQSIASNLIVLVESEVEHEIFKEKIDF